MNARISACRIAWKAVAVLFAAGTGFARIPPPDWTAGDIETYLRTARIVAVEKDIETGRTMPWRVTLDDGTIRASAIFKYIDRPSLLPTRHCYRFELAAYALSRLVALDIVPPVVERTVENTKGALQWYVEACRSERDRERLREAPPDLAAFFDRLADVEVFEALAGDECGDKDDTLIHRDTWNICRVDFSEAFRPETALPYGCILQRCSRVFLERLETLPFNEIKEHLQTYLSDKELEALDGRRRLIVALFRDLIREKGEAAVLFEKKIPGA